MELLGGGYGEDGGGCGRRGTCGRGGNCLRTWWFWEHRQVRVSFFVDEKGGIDWVVAGEEDAKRRYIYLNLASTSHSAPNVVSLKP